MDFFASQDAARRKTSLLLLYFGLAVFLIIVVIYLAVTFLFAYQHAGGSQFAAGSLWNPDLFVAVVCATLLVVISGSLYKISMLRSGGASVAEMIGGRLIPASSENFLEKRLLNIVEEMAIASGVPVPPVYLLEQEKGINAFAAGYTPEDAVIGITEGALATLNREELQGVVAHEFSHVLNGDMWLDLKLVGFLHGILLIAFIGRSILHGSRRSRNNKNSGGAVLLGLVLLILGYIGVVFGKLIKSGVSRQREYLADAAAVQFTRNPLGLAGALKKIGGLAAGSQIKNNRAEEISHMFFSNSLKSSWVQAFATHPPLAERISRLDPAFDGIFSKTVSGEMLTPGGAKPGAEARPAGEKIAGETALIALAILAADPGNVTRDIGRPLRQHMEQARRLLDSLPQGVREAAKDPFGARAVIYGLLLHKEEGVRARQLEHLRGSADKAVLAATEKIFPLMLTLDEEARLPLMDLSMPSLRSLSLAQFRIFTENISRLVQIDNSVSLFELILEHVVVRRLEKNFVTTQGSVTKIDSVREVAAEISIILTLLARIGNHDAEAARAFAGAVATFKEQGELFHFLAAEKCNARKIGDALTRLARINPQIKQKLIAAAFQSLVHDQQITMQEAEFFRLLVYALDTPLPPWVGI